MSRIGKQPVAVPAGVKVDGARQHRARRRAQGQARGNRSAREIGIKHDADKKADRRHAARRRAAKPVACTA